MASKPSARKRSSPYSAHISHGHDDRSVAPAGRPGHELGDRVVLGRRGVGLGEDVGHPAVRPLVRSEVTEPLGGEPGHVVEVRRGRAEELPVTGPAGPLPLRAVGGDVAGVVAEAPHGGLVQLLQPVVAAGEPPGADEVGVDDHPGDVVGAERARVALDAHVLEAVGGVAGLEPVPRPTSGHDAVDLAGGQGLVGQEVERLQVVRRHLAPVVERLTVRQRDLRPVRAEVVESDPPVDVLADVDDVVPRGQAVDRDGSQLLDAPHGRGGGGAEGPEVLVHDRDVGPIAVVEARTVPAIRLPAEVLALPVDEVGAQDLTVRRRPPRPGADGDPAAVVEVGLELDEQCQLGSVAVHLAGEADLAPPPTVAEHGAEHVCPRHDEVGDVVGSARRGGTRTRSSPGTARGHRRECRSGTAHRARGPWRAPGPGSVRPRRRTRDGGGAPVARRPAGARPHWVRSTGLSSPRRRAGPPPSGTSPTSRSHRDRSRPSPATRPSPRRQEPGPRR